MRRRGSGSALEEWLAGDHSVATTRKRESSVGVEAIPRRLSASLSRSRRRVADVRQPEYGLIAESASLELPIGLFVISSHRSPKAASSTTSFCVSPMLARSPRSSRPRRRPRLRYWWVRRRPSVSILQPTRRKGIQISLALNDGVSEIVQRRRPLADYDVLLKDWLANGGEQMRREYLEAMAAARAPQRQIGK